MIWYVGETRFVVTSADSAEVSSVTNPSSAVYTIYDIATEDVVTSGQATVSGVYAYFLWAPTTTGGYIADVDYVLGTETKRDRKYIEVKGTI